MTLLLARVFHHPFQVRYSFNYVLVQNTEYVHWYCPTINRAGRLTQDLVVVQSTVYTNKAIRKYFVYISSRELVHLYVVSWGFDHLLHCSSYV